MHPKERKRMKIKKYKKIKIKTLKNYCKTKINKIRGRENRTEPDKQNEFGGVGCAV